MLIRLEYQGRVIHETNSAAVTQEIVIGRSHTVHMGRSQR